MLLQKLAEPVVRGSGNITPEDILACKGKLVVFDTETNGLRYWENELIGIGIYCPELDLKGYAHVCRFEKVPYGKPKRRKVWLGKMDYSKSKRGKRLMEEVVEQEKVGMAIPDRSMRQPFLEAFKVIANDPQTTLVAHNLKFDANFVELELWRYPCRILDTTVLVHLLDSRLPKALAKAEDYFLGSNTKRQHVSKAEARFKNSPWMWEPHILEDYCVNDCVVTQQLMELLLPRIREYELTKLLSLQMRYLRLLQKIERKGILIDNEFCRQAVEIFSGNLENMERDLYDACGYEFNWRSVKQLGKAIYDDLGIPKPVNPFADEDGVDRSRFAQRGMYNESCTSSFLLMEKANHPLGGLILDMRETSKLRDYIQKYMDLQDSEGVIHASFRQTGTRTGRLSSAEPNLQNIPSEHRVRETQSVYTGGAIRSDEYNLRKALIARPGYRMLSIDHRQQEMRMFGILAQEPIMLEALRARKDIHMEIAKAVWGDLSPEENSLHREWSKTIGFGLIYGMTTGSLQHRLNKTAEEALKIAEDYWTTFPRIQPWLREVVEEVSQHGYVRYWSGRLWFEEKPEDYYKGANAQIQGGAADFMSVALLRADQVLEAQGWGSLISIIHDEALFEIKEECLEEAAPVLARVMECEDIFDIPFATDAKVGDSYGSMEKYPLSEDLSAIDWKDYL